MGWKLAKKERDAMLQRSHAVTERTDGCDVAVVDGTALMYLASTGSFVQSARRVAARLIKLVTKDSRAEIVVLCFDGPAAQMPPCRGKLHATRYKKKTAGQLALDEEKGKIIVAGRSYKPGTEPYPADELKGLDDESSLSWTRLLASRAGKAVATSLLIKGLMHDAQANPRGAGFRLIISGGGAEVTHLYPRSAHAFDPSLVDQITEMRWGEADNRVARAVQIVADRHPDKSIRVFTIDTDSVIQLLCIELGEGPPALTLDLVKSDLIDVHRLRQSAGSTSEERLSAAALLLCAKGCDYSDGMTIFGYRQKPFVDAAFLNKAPFVRRTEGGGLAVDTETFARVIKHVPRWAIKSTTSDDVRNEMVGLLTTLGLFSLVGPQNSPPGPRDVSLGDCSGGASSDPFAAICIEGLAQRGEPIVLE